MIKIPKLSGKVHSPFSYPIFCTEGDTPSYNPHREELTLLNH